VKIKKGVKEGHSEVDLNACLASTSSLNEKRGKLAEKTA
jgi:hypothetical protein